MTSSLVGSEMCIRDSPQSHRRHTHTGARTHWGPWLLYVDPCGTESTNAVSYTHLTLPTICSV
eukprot:4091377-Prorocentrum_lima.AAC.1